MKDLRSQLSNSLVPCQLNFIHFVLKTPGAPELVILHGFACRYSERVKKLVIVDIAAKPYPPHYDAEFRAMKRAPAGALDNRREAEELLKPLVPDWGMRQFLMTNLVHGEFGLQWQINLEVLHASLQVIRQNPLAAKDVYEGPALLLSGEQSDFVNEDDIAAMQRWFPNLSVNWSHLSGSNRRPDDYKSTALPAELRWPYFFNYWIGDSNPEPID